MHSYLQLNLIYLVYDKLLARLNFSYINLMQVFKVTLSFRMLQLGGHGEVQTVKIWKYVQRLTPIHDRHRHQNGDSWASTWPYPHLSFIHDTLTMFGVWTSVVSQIIDAFRLHSSPQVTLYKSGHVMKNSKDNIEHGSESTTGAILFTLSTIFSFMAFQ